MLLAFLLSLALSLLVDRFNALRLTLKVGKGDGFVKTKAKNQLMMSSPNDDPKLAAFLQGNKDVPWNGRTDILARRKQVPDSSYSPQEVVRKCLDAFQVNDDPQLDHGCCVLLGFKSPLGPLAEGGLDPAAYGRFLRASPDYSLLVDHSNSDLIGEPEPVKDSLSVRQSVKVQGWRLGGGSEVKNFDFYLTKVDDKWLMDVVLIRR